MPALNPEQLPILAAALLRLRGQTLTAAAQATGIRAANLSVWLRGKEQVISAARVTGLLHHLGIEGGRLRDDVLHQWADHGALDQLKVVCALLRANDPQHAVCLFRDDQSGLVKTRFVQWGDAWIRLALTPDATGTADLATAMHAERVITLPVALAGIPTESASPASSALLELAEQVAVDVGDEELLDGLMHKLAENDAAGFVFNTASASGWVQLENALRAALRAGANPAELAQLIAAHYR